MWRLADMIGMIRAIADQGEGKEIQMISAACGIAEGIIDDYINAKRDYMAVENVRML